MAGDRESAARLLKVLAAEARVAILRALKERALCVGALAHRLEMAPSAVSQHLRILREAGLVAPERRGNYVHYRLEAERLEECRRLLDELLAPAGEARGCLDEPEPEATR